MNAFFDLRIDTVHYRGNRGGVIMSGNCMLSGNRYIASISRDILLDLPVICKGKIWRLWGIEKECGLQFPDENIVETMIYVSSAQNLSSTYENIVNFIIDEDKIGLSESRQLLELFDTDLIGTIARNDAEALMQVLPEKIALQLCSTFSNSSGAEASRFLNRLGVQQSTIKKIVAIYRTETIQKIIEDPYRLLSFGISWNEVDHFALTYCQIESKSKVRLQAAIEESLYRTCEDGSTVIKLKDLRQVLESILKKMPLVHKALAFEDSNGQYHNMNSFYYPAGAWLIEQKIADWMSQQIPKKGNSLFTAAALKQAITKFEESENLKLSTDQKTALKTVTTNSMSLIIGAHGVGKRTTLKCLYAAVADISPSTPIYRIALSGAVIAQMNELSTCTTHTLASFAKLASKNAIVDESWIVIEEASMIDNVNFFRLMNCLPDNCKMILVGDDKQLTPLGVGFILNALAELKVPKTLLEHEYISPEVGSIGYVLQAVRQGIWRGINAYSDDFAGVAFVSCKNTEIDNNVLELYKQLSVEGETQVICPTQSGSGGADTLNALIQPQANMSLDALTYIDEEFGIMSYQSNTGAFTVGDKVVYTKNSHTNELRNGSLGTIVKKLIPAKANSPICKVDFGIDGVHSFKAEELENLEMAYAITAHRSQGYQFKSVIIPIRQSRLLERSLLYMAISRGVEQIILVGNKEAAINAVEKIVSNSRTVGLTHLIADKYK